MAGFSVEQAKAVLEGGISQAQELIQDPSQVKDLLAQLDAKIKEVPVLGESFSDLQLMISMVKGYITREYTEVSPKVIALVVSAFIYLVKRKDLIPDSVPVLGYADDLAIIGLALKLSETELDAFKAWKEGSRGTGSEASEASEASTVSAASADACSETGCQEDEYTEGE